MKKILIEIKDKARGKTGCWKTVEALDTPFLRSRLCARPECKKYVGTKYRDANPKNRYCSLECVHKAMKGVMIAERRKKI